MGDFALSMVLTSAGVGLAAVFVASIVQLFKGVLPEAWQTGRAILAIVYAVSAVLVALALGGSPEVTAGLNAFELTFLAVFSWHAIAGAAVGSNQLARKGEAIVKGTTDTTGQDPPHDGAP